MNLFEKMLAMLPDELHIVKPYKEYFVGHSVEHMDKRICAVAEAEATAQALAKDKSMMNQEDNYDSSSDDDYSAGSS
eukprot:11068971-Ditylum_brightwellii.AAC.1